MRIMTKIKELLAGREKLAKYDELTEWKEQFKNGTVFMPPIDSGYLFPQPLPDHIKQIIVSAIDAEIKKLDEE